jgi:hypothetical protein
MTTTCARCGGVGWCCEQHPQQPNPHDGCMNQRAAGSSPLHGRQHGIEHQFADRHWLSDVVFGASVGIIAGRTVTRHGPDFPVAVTSVPGGFAIL